MSSGYVLAGYGITVGSLALYTMRVLRRGRVLARSLPGDVPLAGPGGPTALTGPAARLDAAHPPAPAGDE